jgi:hypothetical protein
MSSRDPELRKRVDLRCRHDYLNAAVPDLLAEQAAVLGELAALVKRHVSLGDLARRFPELERLQVTAEYAGRIVELARRLETYLSEARIEVIIARSEAREEIDAVS